MRSFGGDPLIIRPSLGFICTDFEPRRSIGVWTEPGHGYRNREVTSRDRARRAESTNATAPSVPRSGTALWTTLRASNTADREPVFTCYSKRPRRGRW